MDLPPLGGGPEEPGGAPDEWSSGGWIPPDGRSWRHPSEVAGPARTLAPTLPVASRRPAAVVVVATTAAAIALGLLLLSNAASGPPAEPAALTVDTAAVTACCRLAPAVANGALDSVVTLSSARSGRLLGYGVVVGDGGLVATTIGAISGRGGVMAEAATGHQVRASIVGTDDGSGVALLRLPESLPDPSGSTLASGGADLYEGDAVMSVSVTRRDGAEQPRWNAATVTSLDTSVSSGDAAGLALIAVRGSSMPDISGDPLVDAGGQVVGLLVAAQDDQRVYLPMAVVSGVAEDLEMTGRVPHSWLDLQDTTGDGGALVVSVESTGAASQVLSPGDVIISIDGTPVASCIELRTMLYGKSPGTVVTVGVVHHGQTETTSLALSPSP